MGLVEMNNAKHSYAKLILKGKLPQSASQDSIHAAPLGAGNADLEKLYDVLVLSLKTFTTEYDTTYKTHI